ncbi:TonB-dependent receptor [Moheibacter sp. BDHS18]|uniref:TonB-dependent receptor n=2 Tax=Moheibacter lacus TaxID=2745851 RepID=A0A838ZMW9_9FLAO|nr:TonB-dependent receptor [Moheibacter lacus]
MKMKKLNFLLILGSLFQLGHAQIDSITLEEVYLSDNRIALPLSQTDRSVSIITKEDIQLLPVNSIEELLSHQIGVDVRQRGTNGLQADVAIRGGSFEQTLIMINGVRMSDTQTGHHSMDIPVSLEAIERIEIVKGPASRRYGQNAYTGAINIITKTESTPSLQLGLEGGEFGTFGVNAGVQTGGTKFQQMFQGNYNQTDGYRHNTDSKKTNFWYQNELNLGKHSISLQGGFIEKRFGANGFYATPSATEQYEETQSSVVSLLGNFKFENLEISPSVYWRRHQDMYVFVREDPSIYRNMHIGNTAGATINTNYKSKLGITGFGVEGRREFLSSNNLGDWDRSTISLFLEHRISLLKGKLSITPGAMWADYSDFGSYFYPGIDVGYSFNPHHRIYGNIGKTYRTPTYTDLYYQDPVNEGNPDLKPEEALTYEIGYKFNHQYVTIEANVFRRENENLIDWVKENEDDKWKPYNLAEINTQGFELKAEHSFHNMILNKISLSYTYLDNELKDYGALLSRYTLDNLKHQLSAKLNHNIIKNLSVEWVYRYNYRVALGDYHLLDSKLMYKTPKWEIFVQGNNLFNTNYTETNLIPMPGRWFSGGVQFSVF